MRLLHSAIHVHFLILILLSLTCPKYAIGQKIGFYIEGEKSRLTFPFELYNTLIVVPISINNQHGLKFILDTGVRNSILISREYSDSLVMNYQRRIQLLGIGDKPPVNALVTNPVSIDLPGIACNGLSILVLEEDFMDFDHYLGTKIDGLIGYDLFRRFVVKINYSKKKITLIEPSEFKLKGRYESLDLEIVESKPLINARVQIDSLNSINARLLVDTGASHALILNQKSGDEIILPERRIEANLGRGLEGEINGYLARIGQLAIGSRTIEDIICSFPDINNFEDKEKYSTKRVNRW